MSTDGGFETILYAKEGAVATLTLNRPGQRNAMNRTVLKELHRALDIAAADDEVRVLVLTGAGSAFCAGFDLKEQADAQPHGLATWRALLEEDSAPLIRFWRFAKPTIAAVHGACIAGGCELALCCDITIAAEDAVFGEPEMKFGASIAVLILPWLTGAKKAKELLLLGEDSLPAAEAARIGLVNRVVPVGTELSEALALARRLAVVDPQLLRTAKAAINRTYDLMGQREALQASLDLFVQVETEGCPDKAAFMDVLRAEGVPGAVRWRDARFAPPLARPALSRRRNRRQP